MCWDLFLWQLVCVGGNDATDAFRFIQRVRHARGAALSGGVFSPGYVLKRCRLEKAIAAFQHSARRLCTIITIKPLVGWRYTYPTYENADRAMNFD